MAKMFQLYEEDLADLERILPMLADDMLPHLTPKLKTQFRRAQTILSNVRWSYGPPSHVETVSDDPSDEAEYQDS